MRYVPVLIFLICSLIVTNNALRILVIFPMPSKSHSILGHGVVDRLLEAGHEVVHITSFPKENKLPKLRELNVSYVSDYYREKAEESDFTKIKTVIDKGNFGDTFIFNIVSFLIHKNVLEEPSVVQLLSDPNEHFDAVIIEWFFSELFAGIPNLFNAPLIWAGSTEPHWQVLRIMDETPNPAYNVDLFTNIGAPLGFWDRVDQLYRLVKKSLLLNFIQAPAERWVYNSIYPAIAAKRGVTMPSYSETVYNGSLLFLNTHPSIAGAMKLPQNAVNIGGYHIQENVKPLPKNLQTIMDAAKNGVIYFSLGSNMLSNTMSEEMIQSILNMFGKLDQTVIWKFESDRQVSVKNVHLVKWAPQPSILAHPNLKLFITHGGQLSTTEAVHYGVPLVGVPIMADQHFNMGLVERKGYGVKVTLAEDMADELHAAIRKVLTDESFRARAKEISSIFHNREMKPGAALVYWVEYVVKTRGALHLRSPALTVCLFQRLYLDLLVLMVVVTLVLRKIFKIVRQRLSKKPSKKNKKE